MGSLIFSVYEKSGISRTQEPLACGVPFSKGLVSDPSLLILHHEQQGVIPFQAHVTAQWCDQSVMWVLLEFQADVQPYGNVTYRLEWVESPPSQDWKTLLAFVQKTDCYIVETGAASFVLPTTVFAPFSSVLVDGAEILDPQQSFLILKDQDGKKLVPYVSNIVVERPGSVRLTLRFEGQFGDEASSSFRFIARLSFFAGSGQAKLVFTLHNPRAASHNGGCWDLGDEGSLYFQDLSWAVGLRDGASAMPGWRSKPQDNLSYDVHSDIEIRQESSGGGNWLSTNHLNRYGKVAIRGSGYYVKCEDVLMMEGDRATPTLGLQTKDLVLVGTIKNFWQNFPKAVETNRGQMALRFFPQQDGELYELQGGEQKTHIGVVDFSKNTDSDYAANWIHDPLRPVIAPEWYAQTKTMRYLSPRSDEREKAYIQFINTAIRPPNSWFEGREKIDEYGWRNFGEVYADHEEVHSNGGGSFISHYNNQYDVIFGLIIEYCRTGDEEWFVLFNELAQHVIDIDIYHTDEDRPAYNGGLFWHTDHHVDAATATHRTYSRLNGNQQALGDYGGGPSNEHNYTTGLLYYYFLTGDVLAAEAVQSLADWVINMDDPGSTFLGHWDRRSTGRATATVDRNFHGPGRGAGNSINALVDAYVLTKKRAYLLKAEEVIHRCVHPHEDIGLHHLEDVEHRWSYTVFLSALGKYLDLKVNEEELDASYAYARGALLHYAAWMVEHEVPYAQILDRVEIPTETWPAQDMRKSHVLNVAAKYAQDPLREVCQEKARFFYDACLKDLSAFETSSLTRPIVLLMTNGFVQAYFDSNMHESAPLPNQNHDFGCLTKFSPQGDELYRTKELLTGIHSSLKRWSSSLSCWGARKGVSN